MSIISNEVHVSEHKLISFVRISGGKLHHICKVNRILLQMVLECDYPLCETKLIEKNQIEFIKGRTDGD